MFNDWKKNSSSLFAPYKNHFVQLAILETLLLHDDIMFENIKEFLLKRMRDNDEIMDSTTLPYIKDRIEYLVKLDLIIIDGEKGIIKLSDEGRKFLKTGAIQNTIATTFFNYKTYNISRWALMISVLAAIFSLIALIN